MTRRMRILTAASHRPGPRRMGSRLFSVGVMVASLALPFALVPGPLTGQDFSRDMGQVFAPILLIDRERLFAESAYGMRVSAELEGERQRQEARTRAIEDALKAEELRLTQERASLTPEEFRARADAFDAKVEALRRERDQAENALVAQIEQAQAEFLQQISPVLAGIMEQYGAVILLEKRLTLLAARQVDITDEAIARIDAAFRETETPVSPEPPGESPDVPAGDLPENTPGTAPQTAAPPPSPGDGG